LVKPEGNMGCFVESAFWEEMGSHLPS